MHRCTYCSFRTVVYRKFCKHMRSHEDRSDFSIKCFHCPKSYVTLRQFQRHIEWHNVVATRDGADIRSTDHQSNEDRDAVTTSPEIMGTAAASVVELQPQSFLERPSTSVRTSSCTDVADFVLSLESQNVPQKICESIVAEFKKFGAKVVQECMESSRVNAPELTKTDGENQPGMPAAVGSLAQCDVTTPSIDALADVDTHHKLMKFATQERGYIPPNRHLLDSATKRSVQNVSIVEQLRTVLSCSAHEMDFGRKEHSGLYRDVRDGSVHDCSEDMLHLILYFDEFVISNPIGNKTRKYSIGAVYYAIANVRCRSSKHDVFLGALFHAVDLKKYGWETVLSPMLNELSILETVGVTYRKQNATRTVKCVLAMIVGDNKGSHQIGGYFTSFFNTSRICRSCHATTPDIKEKFEESQFELRTRAQYDSEIRHLELESFDEKIQQMFGIRQRCVFNQLDSFHCIDGLPFDATHDLFEKGVVTRTIEQVLETHIKEKVASLEGLNGGIQHFTYHRTDTNKPQPLRRLPGGKLSASETCSETWTLLRLLPLILLDTCPGALQVSLAANQKHAVLTSLIRLVMVLMADAFSEEDVEALQREVSAWLTAFHREFPSFQMTPKFHNLIHYPQQIRKHGPPCKYASIRFEAKHQEMKGYLSTSRNRINPCKSMAECHQLKTAIYLHQQSAAKEQVQVAQPSTAHPTEVHGDESCSKLKRLLWHGYTYYAGDCVSVCETDGSVTFVVISEMSDANGVYKLDGWKLVDVVFVEELMAFRVRKGPMIHAKFEDLFHYKPMGVYEVRDSTYVVPQMITQFKKK